MEANNTIEIHEFSTGIRAEKTADGGWVSLGFTGQYMNMTLQSIPSAVENSINEKEFEVTEGASSDKPAIIGRVVESGGDKWSVVAVVTRGQDNVSRSFSAYRYFLCKGENNIEKILAWLDARGIPTFDPFDPKFTGQPYPCPEDCPEYTPESSKVPDINFKDSEPTLLEPEKCNDFKILNFLATKKSKENKQPISWAYNIEALEKPRKFQLIQPANPRAYNILDKVIKNIPHSLAPVIMDEEAIKSAIRGLINSSQVKPEAVQKIAEAVQNEQISNEYWHSLFDAQGAKIAISQKIYSPQMVRLITLRAMVIPETLPEFMDWLNFKGSKSKLDDNQTISLDFQKAIQGKFPTDKLTKGIKLLLVELLNHTITPESVHLLLIIKGSAWHSCCKEFINDVFDDLQIIAKQVKRIPPESFKCQPETWKSITSNWKLIPYKRNYNLYKYKPIAQLFELLKHYQLSAYFYQISDSVVPKYIYQQKSVQSKLKLNAGYLLGLTLYPKLTPIDKTFNFIFKNIEHFAMLTGIIIIITILLLMFKKINPDISNENNQEGMKSQAAQTNTDTKSSNEKENNATKSNKDNQVLINEAVNKFDITSRSIINLINEINKHQLNKNKKNILEIFLIELNIKNIDLIQFESLVNSNFTNIEQQQKSDLSKAIFMFQQKNGINPNGILSIENLSSQSAYYKLRDKIKSKLNETSDSTQK